MNFSRQVVRWALSEEALHGRMSFIAGPRQVGKTTAVKQFLTEKGPQGFYYNWDTPTVKRKYAANPSFFMEEIPPELPRAWVAFDEIHKYPQWKNLLKGYYDEWKEKVQFIVTGSARLDWFRRSGDSLVGRYFLFRMLPLGVKEILGGSSLLENDVSPQNTLSVIPSANSEIAEVMDGLLRLTGFPEPLAVGTEEFCTRWRDNHISLIVREDLRDLTKIFEIQKVETLLYLLPDKVGSPLSLNSLCQSLECAHATIRSWLEALKRVYLIFSIPPWTTRLARSILKEEKYYFWDWGMVEVKGFRFENFLAVQLKRAIASWNERGKGPFKLHYLRTKEGQEVDFVVADRKRVYWIIEAKEKDTSFSPHLFYFKEKVGADLAIQVVNQKGTCIQKGKGFYVIGADRFLSLLP
jgi:predicted AAA+ superfamily ATPase